MRRKEMSWVFFEARTSGLIHGLCPHISLALASWSVALGLKLSLLLPLLSTVILPGASKGVQAINSRTKLGTVVCPIAFHFLSRYNSDIPTSQQCIAHSMAVIKLWKKGFRKDLLRKDLSADMPWCGDDQEDINM